MAGGHSLTRVGDNYNPRYYYRRDTNCPAQLLYRADTRSKKLTRVDVRVVNLSEHGVLLVIEGIEQPLYEAYVVLPGIRAKIAGKVVRQGDFILALDFEILLPPHLVDRIARIEAPAVSP